ncbi:hypothetical protein ACINWC692_1920 [Acinetobacter baumannii WC-692]|nr:hypothetical protein ACINWC692_1920 [Acinetobacter baumannii WC-692]EKL60468.1 hypothetical protein ACIN5110_1730 [Acinetobacter baumannii OIFC110]
MHCFIVEKFFVSSFSIFDAALTEAPNVKNKAPINVVLMKLPFIINK